MELLPTGYDTAEVVWEWHVLDHVAQDANASKRPEAVVGRGGHGGSEAGLGGAAPRIGAALDVR